MSGISKYFTKKQILTIPNAMSLFRLILVPFIVIFYVNGNLPLTIACIVVSGLTDFFDGAVARKFNQISDVGKMLDPVADKLTMGAIIISLATRYSLMIPFIPIFIVCEIVKGLACLITINKIGEVKSSKWYGKVSTFYMYFAVAALFLFPGMPVWLADTLIWISIVSIVFAAIMYLIYYYGLVRKAEAEKKT